MPPRLPDTVEHWPLDRLTPYDRNARTHDDDQVAKIAASILEFGWTTPVLIDDTGDVIAGHGRLLAARKLGLDTIPVIRAAHLTPAQAQAYRLVDNRLAELSGWNQELLAAELHVLNGDGFDLSLIGFDDAELDRLMAPLEDEDEPTREDSDDDADEAPEPPRDPVSRPGDLWRLGDHRLLCGDSTNAAAVARVMNGERASLLFTSPPYGNQRDYTTGGIGDWDALMRGSLAISARS
jgi:ParB-like chromosome segregation protein Spo0J